MTELNNKLIAYLKTHEYIPLIIFTFTTLVLYPYIELNNSVLLYHIMISLILISWVWSIWDSKQFIGLAVGIWTLSFILSRADFFTTSSTYVALYLWTTFLFFSVVLVEVIWSIFNHTRIHQHLIYASIAWYLMIWMVGAFAFGIIEVTYPWSFSPAAEMIWNIPSFLYYSFVSMLTIGYWDLIPTWPHAQMRSVILAIAWQIYLTVILGTLIGKYVREKKE